MTPVFYLRFVLGLFVVVNLVVGCQSGPDAAYYAGRLCECSEDFSKAAVQLQAGTIDRATYDQLKAEQEACMGEDDPLQDLKDDPEALKAFKADFLQQLNEQCPNTARNLNF